jgi:prepilin-type N-terminal cleavage/methylation domain-containing protein
MLNKIKNRNQEGFTIIEVLIVLAIAGLILLIVFLAVPALQRNSRNTTKKNDVSKALAAANEWVSNNSGKIIPASDSDVADTAAKSILTSAGLSSGVKIVVIDGSAAANYVDAQRDTIIIATKTQCSNNGVITAPLAGITGAKYDVMTDDAAQRAYTALYVIESSGTNFTSQCQGS